MLSSATTTITIYRGQTEDEWGDDIDLNTVVDTGVVASITELEAKPFTETSMVPRVIRTAIGRVGSQVDIRANDRIYDEKHNETWTIRSISRKQSPVCATDTRLDLQRVD